MEEKERSSQVDATRIITLTHKTEPIDRKQFLSIVSVKLLYLYTCCATIM